MKPRIACKLFLCSLISVLQQVLAQWAPERHPQYDAASSADASQVMASSLRIAPALAERLIANKAYPFGNEGVASELKLRGWRGERCSAQLAVQATGGAAELSVFCDGLRMGESHINAQVSMLRYTQAEGVITADVIGRESCCYNPAGVNRGVWFSVDIPRTTQPGVYRGVVRVAAPGCEAVELPVELEVLDAVLPAPADWKFHLDLWQHPQSVARWHDVEPWSAEHFALMKPVMQRLADAGQKCITCTLLDEAWNGQTYDTFPSMVRWIRGRDGVMRYDYSVLDAWISFMHDEVGIQGQISCYSMLPWHLSVRYYDEASGQEKVVKAQPGTAAFREVWAPFLQDFYRHMQEKGWAEKTCIAIDERPDNMVREAMALVQQHAPGFRIASAVDKPSELTRSVYNISPVLTHAGTTQGELLQERREAGFITSFYVCLHPARPNTFTRSVPAEAEWLGLFAAANHLDGFLRWAYNSWNRNPLACTDFVHWPSGDCFLVYPGNRSSIRFERLRDGVEDYEKIQILRARAGESAHAAAIVAEMNRRLAEIFTVARSAGTSHTEDVLRAQEIMEETRQALARGE